MSTGVGDGEIKEQTLLVTEVPVELLAKSSISES